jgi:uncharacterized membrane protein
MREDEEQRTAEELSGESHLAERILQNISSISDLERRHRETISPGQRRMERISQWAGHPMYPLVLLLFVLAWIGFNFLLRTVGFRAWDHAPFELLQGILTLTALLTTTTVLVAQNRQVRLAEQRAHLDLQINLLTEQKVSKLIHLIEELRRDLPGVRDREDPHAAAFTQTTSATDVAEALSSQGLTGDEGARR